MGERSGSPETRLAGFKKGDVLSMETTRGPFASAFAPWPHDSKGKRGQFYCHSALTVGSHDGLAEPIASLTAILIHACGKCDG